MALAQNYNPRDFEEKIYKLWQDNQLGSPEKQAEEQDLGSNSDTYTILMPPPNLTGDLHAGHAFGHYLMDTLTRVYRQKGKKSLWFPGVDHAGIQMEGVINKILKEEEIDREHITEEEFLDFTWQKAMEWKDNQRKQSAVLGDSPDYERNLFTLDDRAANMVTYAFTKYWSDGLIYKGSYLVNWSVGLQTALSDVSGEIEYEKRKDPFVTFEYRLESVSSDYEDIKQKLEAIFTSNPIIVSTVRPETVFGDTAVVIHPEKLVERLQNSFDQERIDQIAGLIESGAIVLTFKIEPLEVSGVKLLISDKVDKGFGTGALKITPGHDPFDYEMYKEFVGKDLLQAGFPVVVGRDGKLTDACPEEFRGLSVEDGRILAIRRLLESGYIPKAEEPSKAKLGSLPKELQQIEGVLDYRVDWEYEHNVTVCERSKTIIEPLVSEEFFLSYSKPTSREGKSLQRLGLEGVEKTRFFSEDFRQRGVDFLENIHDWCISRDLTWGHKMPVWYCEDCNSDHRFGGPGENIAGLVISEEEPAECPDCKSKKLVREKKILDTWFSSSLWPLSTLGFYESQKKIKYLVFDWFGVVFRLDGEEIETTKSFIKEQVEAGVKCYYLSNADEDLFNKMKEKEVFKYFSGGIASFESQYAKPDLEYYHELIEKYDLEPSQSIYVDDSPANVEAGKHIGMFGIWYDGKINLKETVDRIEREHLETDFEIYYPTQAMTTAKEIFYLWIVRMIVLGMYFGGDIPFEDVVITPTVLDGQGRKMSKSLKNGLEPTEAIEKFSSDSLRLGMLSGMIPNRNLRFGGDVADTIMEKNRNFGNKIWNIARFFEYNKALELDEWSVSQNPAKLSPASQWIVGKYIEVEKVLENNLDNYELAHSVDSLVKFLWDYFADWYIEYLKTDPSQIPFALELYKQYLITLSPYMPFETEAIWLSFFESDGLLAFEKKDFSWSSQVSSLGVSEAIEFDVISDFISNLRSLRGLFAIDPSVYIQVYTKSQVLLKYSEFVKLVARCELVNEERPRLYSVETENYLYYLDILSYIKDSYKERQRTEKYIKDLEKQVGSLQNQLGNEKFIANADPEVVEEKKQDLAQRQSELSQQQAKMEFLKNN